MTATDSFTIDELARRTGQSVRNIRAHQSRGLLDPPRLRGRTGLYGPQHEERLQLIARLQDEGFSLASIGHLLHSSGGEDSPLLDLQLAFHAPFRDEQVVELSVEELRERFDAAPGSLANAMRLGVVRDAGDGRVAMSQSMLDGAQELHRLGVPLDRIFDVAATLRESARAVAGSFSAVFIDAVWAPFVAEGMPADRSDEVRAALDRLHPLASRTLVAALNQAMLEEIERALEQQ
jgi:DNA-binding transcriptional MerR regulator